MSFVEEHATKVLIADDSIVSRHVLDATLRKWGYDVVVACDGLEAWDILQSPNAPALAVLDWMMPGLTGLDVCRQVRSHGKEPYIYILLLTSKSLKEDLIEGMEAGADDYLIKPFDQHELHVRLRAGARIVKLQAELMEAREALREQATHDALTHLANRPSILEMLDREMRRALRDRGSVGVVLIDLDNFKAVNDTYGHIAGDAVLQEAARRMQTSVRNYDALGRYGGEEFLLVLPGCDERRTAEQAERLRLAIGLEPMRLTDSTLKLTASFGCASTSCGSYTTPEAIIHAADEALYQAKRNGRNCVVSAPRIMRGEVVDELDEYSIPQPVGPTGIG